MRSGSCYRELIVPIEEMLAFTRCMATGGSKAMQFSGTASANAGPQ